MSCKVDYVPANMLNNVSIDFWILREKNTCLPNVGLFLFLLPRSNQTSSHTAWARSPSTALPGCGQPRRRNWVWILGRFTPNVSRPWIKCFWPDFQAQRKTRGTAEHNPVGIWCQQRLVDDNNTDSGAAKGAERLWSWRHWACFPTYLRVFNYSSVSGTFRSSFQNYRSYFGAYTLDTKQESWKQSCFFFRVWEQSSNALMWFANKIYITWPMATTVDGVNEHFLSESLKYCDYKLTSLWSRSKPGGGGVETNFQI